MAKDKKRTSTETARRIWLAGIGAYGRAFTEAQEALKDVTGKSSEVFDDLVQKGQMIEKVVEVKSKDMLDKAKVPDFDLDDRIKAMRARLARGADTAPFSETYEDRLAAVEAKLDKILMLLESKKPAAKKPAAKKTARKAPAKRTTTQRKKKTTTKKPPIKRSSVKKSPAKK